MEKSDFYVLAKNSTEEEQASFLKGVSGNLILEELKRREQKREEFIEGLLLKIENLEK